MRGINLRRRTIGVAVAMTPLVLLVASVVCGAITDRPPTGVAMAVMTGGALIAGLNFYLSLVRPLFYYALHSSRDGYRHVSGLPFVGTLLICAGAALAFGNVAWSLLGIAAYLSDTGGILWFVVATWRDQSLWDK